MCERLLSRGKGLDLLIRPLDVENLRLQFREAKPFRFACIDDFLVPEFGETVARSYFSRADAARFCRRFRTVSERGKVQVTDYERFPPAVRRLADALAAPEFMKLVADSTGIPDLVFDTRLTGAGMQQTACGGHLDVHIDFNLLFERLHRRLNLTLYLNPGWKTSWGGMLELWGRDVAVRHHAIEPLFNRCVLFETTQASFHGVTAVKCPRDTTRNSFSVFYYTREPPPHWSGSFHDTIFRARPDEHFRRVVLLPAERLRRRLLRDARAVKRKIARFFPLGKAIAARKPCSS